MRAALHRRPIACACWRRYQVTSDATKAMQQLDGLEIAGSQISVKVAPLTPSEVQATAAAAAGIDLDDAEGEASQRAEASQPQAAVCICVPSAPCHSPRVAGSCVSALQHSGTHTEHPLCARRRARRPEADGQRARGAHAAPVGRRRRARRRPRHGSARCGPVPV